MIALAERRAHVRKQLFKAAHIVLSENAAKFECTARDLSAQGVRLSFSTTYGIPHRFDVVVDGKRKSGRSVWRTNTEMGVIFSEASQSATDPKLEHERDIVPLIELLKMAGEKWPSSEPGDVSEDKLFQRDQVLLEMWPEACRRAGVEVHEFPAGVIERWQQKMGLPN
jgi:hypothetical protein